MSQLLESVTGLEDDHNLTICLLFRRKNVLKPCRGMHFFFVQQLREITFAIRQ